MEISQIERDIERDLARHVRRRKRASNPTQAQGRAEHSLPLQTQTEPHAVPLQTSPAFIDQQHWQLSTMQAPGNQGADARQQGHNVHAPSFPRWNPTLQAAGQGPEPRRQNQPRSPTRLAAPTPASVLSRQWRHAEFSAPSNIPILIHRPPNADTRALRDYRIDPTLPTFQSENVFGAADLTTIDPRLLERENTRKWAGPTGEGGQPSQNIFENETRTRNDLGVTLFPNLNLGPHNIYNEDGLYNVHPPHGDCSGPHLLGRIVPPPPRQPIAPPARVASQEAGHQDATFAQGNPGQLAEEEHNPQLEDVNWDEWSNFDSD
ncbi:hypothetical protein A1O3_02220 [Capronia epimyces CBS 606.96]|uniref:Uncharacterized protein n=1 Tax=Capronia epimyces CBS 606.96 TaxID=1182542 RepID=W9YIS2_9EURO|nr:uncharacterized protein A1O3_02220 [Capronia epimyces CBS 606.96]EXJ89156.1 hypothetical protein A1O3_02220 [Capronia epimyces CBS 606.96]